MSAEPGHAVQLQFAIDDEARGYAIAGALLQDRLVACVQCVGPVTSRYWWRGSIEQSEEWLFVCKTTTARVDAVIERVRTLHPYDVPEIVASRITAGLRAYLDWVEEQTRPAG